MPMIEATNEAIIALRHVLNRAVLHSGMQVAEVCVYWDKILIAAMSQDLPKLNGAGQSLATPPSVS